MDLLLVQETEFPGLKKVHVTSKTPAKDEVEG